MRRTETRLSPTPPPPTARPDSTRHRAVGLLLGEQTFSRPSLFLVSPAVTAEQPLPSLPLLKLTGLPLSRSSPRAARGTCLSVSLGGALLRGPCPGAARRRPLTAPWLPPMSALPRVRLRSWGAAVLRSGFLSAPTSASPGPRVPSPCHRHGVSRPARRGHALCAARGGGVGAPVLGQLLPGRHCRTEPSDGAAPR